MRESTNGNGQSEHTNLLVQMPEGRAIVVKSDRPKGQGHGGRDSLSLTLPREVQFARLESGGLLDLVRGPSGTLALVVYRDDKATICDACLDAGTRLVPCAVDHSLIDAVVWPASVSAKVDSPRQILDEIIGTLRQYLDLADSDFYIVAHFCLATWFSDLGTVAPYLWIIGPYQGGKTTLLRLMSAFCRRAVLVADVTPAALYSVCDAIRPTLLIDELDVGGTTRSRELGRLLRSGSTKGARVFRGKKAFEVFGSRAVVSRQEPHDAALASRALVVSTSPTQRSFPCLDEATVQKIAQLLQPRLLAFRLGNYSQAQAPEFDATGLSPRTKDLARSLAIPLLGDAELQARVVAMLRPQDEQARLKRAGEPEWVVATALYSLSHRGANYWTVKEITTEAYEVLDGYGETYNLTPRQVGDILRSIGFPTEKLGNQGRGIRVTQHILRSIHKTAQALGLCRADLLDPQAVLGGNGGLRCPLCEEFTLCLDHHGKALRSFLPAGRGGTGLYGPARASSR